MMSWLADIKQIINSKVTEPLNNFRVSNVDFLNEVKNIIRLNIYIPNELVMCPSCVSLIDFSVGSMQDYICCNNCLFDESKMQEYATTIKQFIIDIQKFNFIIVDENSIEIKGITGINIIDIFKIQLCININDSNLQLTSHINGIMTIMYSEEPNTWSSDPKNIYYVTVILYGNKNKQISEVFTGNIHQIKTVNTSGVPDICNVDEHQKYKYNYQI